MAQSSNVRYEVTVLELAFSGAVGSPCQHALTSGKDAKRRALEEAARELSSRASIISVTVTQRGGARDGQVLWSETNPNPYMTAGTPYCAGVRVLGNGQFEFVHGVSRDSRLSYDAPPSYTSVIETVEQAA